MPIVFILWEHPFSTYVKKGLFSKQPLAYLVKTRKQVNLTTKITWQRRPFCSSLGGKDKKTPKYLPAPWWKAIWIETVIRTAFKLITINGDFAHLFYMQVKILLWSPNCSNLISEQENFLDLIFYPHDRNQAFSCKRKLDWNWWRTCFTLWRT